MGFGSMNQITNQVTRVVASFAFGAILFVTGVMLRHYAEDAARASTRMMGSRFSERPFIDTANALLLGGLIIQGFALHGWIVSRSH